MEAPFCMRTPRMLLLVGALAAIAVAAAAPPPEAARVDLALKADVVAPETVMVTSFEFRQEFNLASAMVLSIDSLSVHRLSVAEVAERIRGTRNATDSTVPRTASSWRALSRAPNSVRPTNLRRLDRRLGTERSEAKPAGPIVPSGLVGPTVNREPPE